LDDWLRNLAAIVVLVLAGGVLVAAGTALLSVRRSRIRELGDQNSKAARKVLALLEDPSQVTASTHVGAMVLWLLAAGAAAAGPGLWLAARLSTASSPYIRDHAESIGIVVVIVVLSSLVILVAEVFFKSIAAHYAERIALLIIGPALIAARVMKPLVKLISFAANAMLAPFGTRARLALPALTEEELMVLVEAGEEEGVIEEDEKEMIDSIFEFTDTVVRQVMVPRIDMVVLDHDTPVTDAVDRVMECGHSRLPVCEGNVDSIIGIVHAKDLLPILASQRGEQACLREIMRDAFFVPENKRISELLAEFRSKNQQMAVVRDEYGGTAGLVTVEDLIEEIVGEIRDEYDREEPLITVHDGDLWIVDARLNIDELNEQLATHLPEDEFETVGGFVFGMLGKEPELGDSVDFNGWTLTVEEKEGRRLRKIRLMPRTAETPGEEHGGPSGSGPHTTPPTDSFPIQSASG